MKKFSLLLAIQPFLVACENQATPKETSAQKTIVLATAEDVPPFDYEDKGNLTGLDIEVQKAAMKNSATTRFNFKEPPGKASSQDLILVTIRLRQII